MLYKAHGEKERVRTPLDSSFSFVVRGCSVVAAFVVIILGGGSCCSLRRIMVRIRPSSLSSSLSSSSSKSSNKRIHKTMGAGFNSNSVVSERTLLEMFLLLLCYFNMRNEDNMITGKNKINPVAFSVSGFCLLFKLLVHHDQNTAPYQNSISIAARECLWLVSR